MSFNIQMISRLEAKRSGMGSCGLILFSLLNLTPSAQATLRSWPHEVRTTHLTFSSIRDAANFIGFEGVTRETAMPETRAQFGLLRPENWVNRISCNQKGRGTGFVHTVSYLASQNLALRPAVPLYFDLKTSLVGTQKERILEQTFLKIRVLRLDFETMEWVDISAPDAFTVKNLLEYPRPTVPLSGVTQGDPSENLDTLNVAFDYVLVGQERRIDPGQTLSIRVEWFTDGICGEDSFEFGIGDQIRFLK